MSLSRQVKYEHLPEKNDTDYQAALAEIDKHMDACSFTPEGDALDIWVTLVESYEAKQFPISTPDSINVIKYRMGQQGLGLNN